MKVGSGVGAIILLKKYLSNKVIKSCCVLTSVSPVAICDWGCVLLQRAGSPPVTPVRANLCII